MSGNKLQDADYLRGVAYPDASLLNARIALWQRYASGRDLTKEGLFDLTAVAGDADVLEVGCGPGNLWQWALKNEKLPAGWRITLTDLSEGMLDEAASRLVDHPGTVSHLVADVGDLPFANDSFDLVIAMHMLYHAPDIDVALAEIRRVLKPGGKLYATTNGAAHISEIAELRQRFSVVENLEIAPAHLVFTLEGGTALVEKMFSHVEAHADTEVLEVDDAEMIVNYVASMSSEVDLEQLRSHVQSVIYERRFFPVTRSTGAMVAS